MSRRDLLLDEEQLPQPEPRQDQSDAIQTEEKLQRAGQGVSPPSNEAMHPLVVKAV